jgi:DNA-binding transcriptional MerR regulator
MFAIGDLSRHTGVKVPTIRYYEQVGLLNPPMRSGGNQRRYERPDLERLSFIKHARDLGLSIEAIRELILLTADPCSSCGNADRIARQHLVGIRDKISRLRNLERELIRIVDGCGNGSVVSDCYVLRSVSDHSLCKYEH